MLKRKLDDVTNSQPIQSNLRKKVSLINDTVSAWISGNTLVIAESIRKEQWLNIEELATEKEVIEALQNNNTITKAIVDWSIIHPYVVQAIIPTFERNQSIRAYDFNIIDTSYPTITLILDFLSTKSNLISLKITGNNRANKQIDDVAQILKTNHNLEHFEFMLYSNIALKTIGLALASHKYLTHLTLPYYCSQNSSVWSLQDEQSTLDKIIQQHHNLILLDIDLKDDGTRKESYYPYASEALKHNLLLASKLLSFLHEQLPCSNSNKKLSIDDLPILKLYQQYNKGVLKNFMNPEVGLPLENCISRPSFSNQFGNSYQKFFNLIKNKDFSEQRLKEIENKFNIASKPIDKFIEDKFFHLAGICKDIQAQYHFPSLGENTITILPQDVLARIAHFIGEHSLFEVTKDEYFEVGASELLGKDINSQSSTSNLDLSVMDLQ